MKRSVYVPPTLKAVCLGQDMMLGMIVTSSKAFGEVHETGGSGVVLSNGYESHDFSWDTEEI